MRLIVPSIALRGVCQIVVAVQGVYSDLPLCVALGVEGSAYDRITLRAVEILISSTLCVSALVYYSLLQTTIANSIGPTSAYWYYDLQYVIALYLSAYVLTIHRTCNRIPIHSNAQTTSSKSIPLVC